MTQSNTTPNNPNDAAGAQSTADKKAPASCPLNAPYLQLIPVRYAYVENLSYQQNKQTEKQIHPVGIRLIRDGWLYIVAPEINRIYEHKLEDGIITERTFKGKLTSEVIRKSYQEIEQESNKAEQLIFKKTQKIYVSYSQVQWTDAKCNQMLKAEERKQFMQEIDLKNLSCEHITKHLLTREQAEKYIAEVAEKYQAPEYETKFPDEKQAYSWTSSDFAPCSIGKLTANLRKEYEQKGNYLFMIVKDPIGQMLDLVHEQKLVSKWLGDWSEKQSLKYQIGCYIESTMTITPKNILEKQGSAWLNNLSPEKKQAIADYGNDKVSFDKEQISYYEFDAKNSTTETAASKRSPKYFERAAEVNAKKTHMIETIGQADYEKHQAEIEALTQAQAEYLDGKGFGGRGVNKLVKVPAMKEYLKEQRLHYNRWQQRLELITTASTNLYTQHFHMNTWYYSLQQIEELLKLNKTILEDLFRNDEATKKISEFLDQKPYYTWPGIQVNFTLDYLSSALPDFIKWMRDNLNYVNATTSDNSTELEKLQNIVGKDYWKQIINAEGDLLELQKFQSLNLSQPINYSLDRFIRELMGPAINPDTLQRFNSSLEQYAELSKQLSPSARASFLLEIRKIGFVYLSEAEGATGRASQSLNSINRHLIAIDETRKQLANTIRQRERLRDPATPESTSFGNERARLAEYNNLTRQINRLHTQTANHEQSISNSQNTLAELISPLREGEGNASIRFTITDEQTAAIAFEKQALAQGVLKGYSNDTAKSLYSAGRSARLPAILLMFSLNNLRTEWAKYNKDSLYDAQSKSSLTGSALSVLSSVASVWQTAHATLLNQVVNKVNQLSPNIVGANAIGRLGRLNLLWGGAAQVLGGVASYITLYSNFSKWRDGMLSGDMGLAASSIAAMTATTGNAAVGTYAIVHTAISGANVIRDFRTTQMAASTIWAVRGAEYATAIGRVTPVGWFLTALQLGGEFAYNYYNIDEFQQWLLHSCWGNSDKDWNQTTHNQELATALLKPVLVDKGVVPQQGVPYRIIQAVFPGQVSIDLNTHPVSWEAQWQFNVMDMPNVDTTIGMTLYQNTHLIAGECIAFEWHIPWVTQEEWSIVSPNTLNIRLYHTPDLASGYLGGSQGLGYQIPLHSWTNDRGETINQVKGDKLRIDPRAAVYVYKGSTHG